MRVSLQEGSASQTALPCSAVSTGPIQANMSLTAEKFTPMALPSALMLSTSLAALSTSRTSLSPPYWVRIEENSLTRLWMLGTILLICAAHVTEVVGQRVGPGRQPVEVAGALADLSGAVGQPVTDDARLIGGPELRRHFAEGPGDAADQADVRQLCRRAEANCSRSARACGVRRSRGDWMRMYSGMD